MDLDALLDQQGGLNKGENTPNAFFKLLARAVGLENNHRLSILWEAVLKTNHKATLHRVFMPKLAITGLHVLVAMLWKFQANHLMLAIVCKDLRVLQHLMKHGVVEGSGLTHCTRHFCVHVMCKLLYDLTKHEDDQVRVLASTFQHLRFQMPREPHSTHVSICEEARKKAHRKKIQEEQGLEDGEIPVDKE